MKLPTIEVHEPKDITMCRWAVEELYEIIEAAHGEAQARRLFASQGKPLSKMDQKNLNLLIELYLMGGKPTVESLAKRLAAENEKLPPNERHGPTGSRRPETIKRHINRLRQDVRYAHIRSKLSYLWIEKFSYDPLDPNCVKPWDLINGTFF